MFENIMNFFKKFNKKEEKEQNNSKEAAKERLHLVLMQDRANVSADFLELMKQEIIEVIKKYIEVDEGAIDVRLTNQEKENGTNGAPALYANIPIINIKNETKRVNVTEEKDVKNKEKKIKESIEKEQVEEIQNERIAKVILEGKKYNAEKENQKEKIEETIEDKENKEEKQPESETFKEEKKLEEKKEDESKSKD